jgi:hypothetical protein
MEMLIILPLVFLLVLEFSSHSVYGNFLKDDEVIKYLEDFKPFTVNQFNRNIISPEIKFTDTDFDYDRLTNSKYISKTPLSICSKYHISGWGRISRWSKSHKLINELFKNTK